ncbi:MAG: hypothetical protein ABGW87_09505 [Sphingomonadaceae bacterium]
MPATTPMVAATIPAYIYEIGDEIDRAAIARTAPFLAKRYVPALAGLAGDPQSRCNPTG